MSNQATGNSAPYGVDAMPKSARDWLVALYLDWRNNYLTVAKFAEHNGLTEDEAETLIDLARLVFSHNHPEA